MIFFLHRVTSTARVRVKVTIGSRALSLANPYCQSTVDSVCMFVRNFEVKYLGNQGR